MIQRRLRALKTHATGALAALNSLQQIAAGHVLLYHATFSVVPRAIRRNLHNVTPEEIFNQLTWLKRHFDVVDVDELFADNADVRGKVAVTFDDAYQSVFTEGLPVLRSLGVPSTIYVNAATLAGKPLWRDKTRYLISQSLVPDFLTHCRPFANAHGLTVDNFYRVSKEPHVNSAEIEKKIDAYMEHAGIQPNAVEFCVRDQQMLSADPLVTYGNHTCHHYLLSSLSAEEQEREISHNHEVLSKLSLRVSRVFSVPFGGSADLNDTTIDILRKLGYTGFLYSRGAINFHRATGHQMLNGLPYRERYMVAPTFEDFQQQIFKVGIKSLPSQWFPA